MLILSGPSVMLGHLFEPHQTSKHWSAGNGRFEKLVFKIYSDWLSFSALSILRTFNMSLCEHCVVAVRHEGTATGALACTLRHFSVFADPNAGTIEQIGGIDTYVARPEEADYAKDKAIIIITGLSTAQ